ncbi:MAG: hypothetical protein H6Q15_1305 [Bacteroidetes bacterium]|nr:hypothetical protein [Bacteroidota bacterium]
MKIRLMKRFLFFLLVCLSANIYAQTYNEILRNDNSVIKASLGNRQCLFKINDVDEDTLWVNFIDDMSSATPQSRIMSLDKNLNICSNITIPPYFNRGPMISDKVNDKFYSIDYTSLDTILFVSFDRSGNKLIEKPIWTNNNIDTFGIGWSFKLLTLSNKNFLFVGEVQFPSTRQSHTITKLDAVKFILIDTMANIINTKIYSQKSSWFMMSMCEMGNHIVLDKTGLPVDTGSFSTFGTSFIDKQTLEIVDSIPRKWILDTMSGGDITQCVGNFELESLNDSLYVGIYDKWGHPGIRVINKNTKQEISKIFYTVDGGDDNIPPADGSYWAGVYEAYSTVVPRFAYKNTDSIYTAYLVKLDQTWLSGWIELMNFGIDGKINFVYRFSILDSTHTPFITGMKAYDDGSLVITAMNSVPGVRETWLIKFNPNGLVGLSNFESGEKASLRVYPNPAKDFVLVDIEADRFEKADIEIYDLGGRMVKKSKLSAKVGNRIDVSDLKAGVFSYRVVLNGKGVSGKIVIGE